MATLQPSASPSNATGKKRSSSNSSVMNARTTGIRMVEKVTEDKNGESRQKVEVTGTRGESTIRPKETNTDLYHRQGILQHDSKTYQ